MKREVPVEKGKSYEIEIRGLGHSFEGVGRYKDFTVFVPFALAGETVEVLITEVKKSYAKGRLKKVIKASPDRVEPPCAIYNECGGCQIQHLEYQAQLKAKRQQVVDAIERIGGQDEVVVHPTLGMENPWNYRNKMQFPVGKVRGEVVIGCYRQGSHQIIDTRNCLIQHESNNVIANAVRGILRRLNIVPYDEKTGRGLVRHVIGRVGKASGEVMVVLVTNGDTLPKREKVIQELQKNIPNLVSIMQNINTQNTNVIMGNRTIRLWGKSTIVDKLGEFTFHISARSFFQVNTDQAAVLYQKAVEYAGLTGKETVIDAYCGTGTITLFLAKQAKKVYGIEIIEPAVIDARKNAEENNITNAEFIIGDAMEVMPKMYKEGQRPDVIVVDPPRAGCDKVVLETFASMNPQRIVYVSCNPASLARDIAILSELGYKAEQVQPVDMFGMSSHVESVAKLVRV